MKPYCQYCSGFVVKNCQECLYKTKIIGWRKEGLGLSHIWSKLNRKLHVLISFGLTGTQENRVDWVDRVFARVEDGRKGKKET